MRRARFISTRRFGIVVVLIFGLVVSISGVPSYSNINTTQKQKIIVLPKDNYLEQQRQNRQEIHIKYVESLRPKPVEFIVTSYDLSEDSCNKTSKNSAYGITKTGINLRNKTWNVRIISVDPRVIPLGSKVRIEFKDSKHKKYSGVYLAADQGGAIKGKHIDLFIGDFHSRKPSKVALQFGKVNALVTILSN